MKNIKITAMLLICILIMSIITPCAANGTGEIILKSYKKLSIKNGANSLMLLDYDRNVNIDYTNPSTEKYDYYSDYLNLETEKIMFEDDNIASVWEHYPIKYSKTKPGKSYCEYIPLDKNSCWNVKYGDETLSYPIDTTGKVVMLKYSKNEYLSDLPATHKKAAADMRRAFVDIENGYYNNINILAYINYTCPITVNVYYTDGTMKEHKVQLSSTSTNDNHSQFGAVIVNITARFNTYKIPCVTGLEVDKLEFRLDTINRNFILLSMLGEESSAEELLNIVSNITDENYNYNLSVVSEIYKKNGENSPTIDKLLEYAKVYKKKAETVDVGIENLVCYLKAKKCYESFGITDGVTDISPLYEDILKNTETFNIYVQTNGDDNGDGTEAKPFATIKRAQKAIEEANLYGFDYVHFNVIIGEGTYFLNERLEVTGKNTVTYEAEEERKVILTSSQKLNVNDFEVVSDDTMLKRLPDSSRYKVKQLNLTKAGVEKVERFLPNSTYEVTEDVLIIADSVIKQVAQYPNGNMDMVFAENVLESGEAAKSNFSSKGGSLEVSDELAERWKNISSMESYLSGCFFEPWVYERIMVDSVSAQNNSINLYSGSYSANGVIGMQKDNWDGNRFKIMHALEELDVPGEWYIDRNSNILYYYPHEDFYASDMRIAAKPFDLVTVKAAENVTFDGITFENARGSAIEINNSANVVVKNCTFKNLSDYGIKNTASTDVLTEGNSFFYTGKQAYKESNCGDKVYLTGSGNVFSNNYVYACSNVIREYAVEIDNCVGSIVKNNLIHYSEMGGVRYSGCDIKIVNNEIYNVGINASDCGAVYTHGKYTELNNEIAYNYLHDIRPVFTNGTYHHRGVYLDFVSAMQNVHHNIIFNTAYGISFKGRYNIFSNNIIAGETKTMARIQSSPSSFDDLDTLRKTYYYNIYLQKYPILSDIDTIKNEKNQVNYNVSQLKLYAADGWLEANGAENEPKGNVMLGIGKYEEYNDPENNDFRIKADSEILNGTDVLTTDFDKSSIGLSMEKVINVKSKIGKAFNLIYPANNSKVTENEPLYFIWEQSECADEYELTIYKNGEKVYSKNVPTNFCVASDFKFAPGEYLWKVNAKNTSLNLESRWQSKEGTFCIGEILFGEEAYVLFDISENFNAKGAIEEGSKDDQKASDNSYNYKYTHVPNLTMLKKRLNNDKIAYAGEIPFILDRLEQDKRAILNVIQNGKIKIEIDITDGYYSELYFLAETGANHCGGRTVKIVYKDGSNETKTFATEGIQAQPKIYTGALSITSGNPIAQWNGELVAHKIVVNSSKIVDKVIIPIKDISVTSETYTLYAITGKKVLDKSKLKANNLSKNNVSLSVIKSIYGKEPSVEICNVPISSGEESFCDVKVQNNGQNYKIFFWNLETLNPYKSAIDGKE